MKNLAVIDTEKLDQLPKKELKNPKWRHQWYGRKGKWKNSFPWGKVDNFLKANRGKPIDEVFSKYCHLEWLPKEFKVREWFSKTLCLNTEMRDGVVWVQGEYGGIFHPLDHSVYRTELYYVHPESRTVEYWHQNHINWKKKQAEEQLKYCRILGDYHQLLKLNGIWHEVKAEKIKDSVVTINGLHWRITDKPAVYRERVCEHVKGVERELVVPSDIDHGEFKNYIILNGYFAVPYVKNWYYYDKKQCGPKDVMIDDNRRNSWDDKWKPGIKIILCKYAGHKTLKKYGLRNDPQPVGKRCKKCGGISGKDCLIHICRKCGGYFKEDCKCHPWNN